jgi:hypothetical protein
MGYEMFEGFDIIPDGDVVSGLAIYRFGRILSTSEHLQFLACIQDAGMMSTNGRLDRASIPALPAMGLKQLFALGHRAPRTATDVERRRAALATLRESLDLQQAWAFLVDTCVDVSERQTTGEIRWRNGAPSSHCPAFECHGSLPDTECRIIERFAVHFKLATRVCPETAGVLVAFCQHWLAPYTDHVAKQRKTIVERVDAQCYLLGDLNIDDDGQTVRFRMDHLIPPGSPNDFLRHTLGVIRQIHGVLPVERAWLASA